MRKLRLKRDDPGVRISALLLLILLIVLPTCALVRLSTQVDWKILAAVPLFMSLYTYYMYRNDKRRAEAGEWRIPESTLHTAELLGGWPGAFIAQRILRHKISKGSYQFTFWIIVLLHQFVACDL